jgi:hypothetical protein
MIPIEDKINITELKADKIIQVLLLMVLHWPAFWPKLNLVKVQTVQNAWYVPQKGS